MKILVINTTDEDITMYYDIDYTLGDKLDKQSLFFHAFFNHQEKTRFKEDYEILPKILGKGRFLGTNSKCSCKYERIFGNMVGRRGG